MEDDAKIHIIQKYTKPESWTDEEWTSLMSAKGYDLHDYNRNEDGTIRSIIDDGTERSWIVTQEKMIDLITRLGKSKSVDVGPEEHGSCFIHFEHVVLEFDHLDRGMDGVQVDISLIMNGSGGWDNHRKLVFTHPSDKVRCSFHPVPNDNNERRLKPVFICYAESLEEHPVPEWDVSDDPEHDTEEAKRLYDLSVSNYVERFESCQSPYPFVLGI